MPGPGLARTHTFAARESAWPDCTEALIAPCSAGSKASCDQLICALCNSNNFAKSSTRRLSLDHPPLVDAGFNMLKSTASNILSIFANHFLCSSVVPGLPCGLCAPRQLSDAPVAFTAKFPRAWTRPARCGARYTVQFSPQPKYRTLSNVTSGQNQGRIVDYAYSGAPQAHVTLLVD